MNRQEFLQTVIKQIHFRFDHEEIELELSQHLDDSIADLIEEGFSKEDAEKIAIEQMGDPIETGKLLNKEHHPLIGHLWMASKVILFLVGTYAALQFGVMAISAISILTPTTVENCEKEYVVDMNYNIPSDKVKIDSICVSKDGEYYVTYRALKNISYSRAYHTAPFHIIDKNGNTASWGSSHSVGFGFSEGVIGFQWPEDQILRLKMANADVVELNLEEYCYE